jgi:hypothetical protein
VKTLLVVTLAYLVVVAVVLAFLRAGARRDRDEERWTRRQLPTASGDERSAEPAPGDDSKDEGAKAAAFRTVRHPSSGMKPFRIPIDP